MDTNATVKATVAVPWLAIVSSTFKYIGIGLYYVTLPVVKLLLLLYYVLRYILSPFIALAQGLLQLVLIPWHVVAKFGPIWYYIGSAVLVGLFSALVLHGIFRTFVFILNLDRPPKPKPKPKPKDKPAAGHDVKSYRKAREQKKVQAEQEQQELKRRAEALANSPLLKEALDRMVAQQSDDATTPRTKPSLLDTTIVEQSSEE